MAGVADSAVGAILEIPESALQSIKNAEAAIKSLQTTSATAAQKIKGHFDNTAVSGLNAFIQKIREAQRLLGSTTMPTIDATGFATSISQIAQAMATVDKSSTTGANRIGRIADSIAKLSAAQPSAQMFQEIANGITAIGNTSQQTIQNVSQLAQTMAQLARDIRTVQNAQRAQSDGTASASQYNKLYKEQADLIRQMNVIKEKGNSATAQELSLLRSMGARYAEIIDQLNKLNQKKQTAASILAQNLGNQRVGNAIDRTTVSGAIDYAKQAKSLRELQDAYKNLKAVMATVDPKSAAWQQMNQVLQQTKGKIDEIRRAMGEFQNQTRNVGDSLGRLKGQLAAAFSVGAIMGYLKKMVEVRGQFELQNVALRAILQNKDEADKIFMQVQQMALQSPFSIMQMTTFTKQLAAYRIESEKLVGTTKMLADVSAGLGVDMGRLILAYGQVKSANYLRATEIRQFTEAGLNIAGELAQYFSELQGKMVSVGDVMEMVTKRMVRFEDVEEVFKRVTSAGGLFYDMQKKQSNTISGMIQRITDAWQIMMNDIGKSNQGLIRDMLDLVRQLISHWRMLVPIIKTVGTLMAGVFVTKGIMAAIQGYKAVRTSIEGLVKSFKSLAMAQKAASIASWTTGIGAAIAIVGVFASYLAGAASEANKLKEALADVQKEGVSDMYNLVFQFRQLADTAKDVTKPYEDRKEAMDALNRTFTDILPSEMLEIENIRKMKDGYDEAVKAIEAYSAAKTKQKMLDTIDSEYGDKLNKAKESESKKFASINWSDILPSMKDIPTTEVQGAVNNMVEAILTEVKNGKIKFGQAGDEFIKMFQNTFNIPDSEINKLTAVQKVQLRQIFSSYSSLTEEWLKMTKEKGNITDLGLPGVTKQSKEAEQQIQVYKNMEQAVTGYKNALQSLKDVGITDVTVDRSKLDEWQVAALEAYDKAASAMGTYKLGVDEVNTALSSNMDMTEALRNVSVNTFTAILDKLEAIARATKNDSLLTWVQTTRREINSLNLSAAQKEMVNFVHEVERLNNVDLGNFQATIVESTTTVADMRKNVESQINILKAQIEAYQNALAAHVPEWIARLLHLDDKGLEQANKELAALTQLYGKLGGGEKKSTGSKSSTDKELKRLQDLGKAIKDVNTKYEELRKSYNVTTSNKMIEDMYSKVFKELGSDIKLFYKDGKYDAEELIKALRILQGQVKATTDERKKYRSELERDIDEQQVKIKLEIAKDSEEQLKKQLGDMFASYELTEEFKKIGVNVDLTYMVGGKPTTLEDIRNEIARLRTEGGGDADSENRIKILEDAEKKITQIELKEQKERLKNYEKYLKKMYSERAQVMIESYVTLTQMEADFEKNIQQLQEEYAKSDTTKERKKEIEELINVLERQRSEASKGIANEKNQKLNKLEWEQFKGSDVFVMMYQDIDTLGKKGIDALVNKLETMRNKLQSMDNVDFKAVKELTQYIEKIKQGYINLQPYTEFKEGIEAAKQLNKEFGSVAEAQARLIELQSEVEGQQTEVSDLEYLIDLQDRGVNLEEQSNALTSNQILLYNKYKRTLQSAYNIKKQELDANKQNISSIQEQIEKVNKVSKAYNTQASRIQQVNKTLHTLTDSAFELADALGGDVDDEWKEFASTMIDSMTEGILLQMQLQMQLQLTSIQAEAMGVAMNSAMGVIGWIVIALQIVVKLMTALFAMHDNNLEKQIQKQQEKVDRLAKSYEKLQDSIEKAFTIGAENKLTQSALNNLQAQKAAYHEMIALEEKKKKTDDEKIKGYKEKLEELEEAEQELIDKKHEKWGSTNDIWDQANDWVDAWLDAFKETGDGLDALNESWDEFYENLVKKQATSAVVSKRMQAYIDRINAVIDSNMDEYGYVDAFKEIGEDFKKDAAKWNEGLKKFWEYAGIGGGAGDLILSDLQKGIQNITEPQAAAIEAYLNSMRSAVFTHTEQLDRLIASIQMQYSNDLDSPVLREIKDIHRVLDNIYERISQVISWDASRGYAVRIR